MAVGAMKISTKGRYALRLMLDLGSQKSQELVSLRDVSQRQQISIKYLEQISSALCRAELLQSGRGARGGYRLTRTPEEYTVGEILRAAEGSLAPVTCLVEEEVACDRAEGCATLAFWQGLADVINRYVDSVTLQDLLDQHCTGCRG